MGGGRQAKPKGGKPRGAVVFVATFGRKWVRSQNKTKEVVVWTKLTAWSDPPGVAEYVNPEGTFEILVGLSVIFANKRVMG